MDEPFISLELVLIYKIRDSGKTGLDDSQFWGTQADNDMAPT